MPKQPCTLFYWAVACELHRQYRRLKRARPDVTMEWLDERAGYPAGYFSHLVSPDTPTGRQFNYRIVQDYMQVLYGPEFRLVIVPGKLPPRRFKSRRAMPRQLRLPLEKAA